ncbi:MAG: tryptophan halogenase [Pirellulaceae bacterium]|jgi:tryptophan halogenase
MNKQPQNRIPQFPFPPLASFDLRRARNETSPPTFEQLSGAVAGQDPFEPLDSRGPPPSEYKTVGILGGGTAGYITALTLRRLRPDLKVTVIESSKIPPIGVGEATTPEIVPYLHVLLGLDVQEFFREVRPTIKLGIRYEWGLPGDYHFNFTFDPGRPLESHLYDGHIRNVSLQSVLMSDMTTPLFWDGMQYRSLLADYPFAYHLDNKRFIAYLNRQVTKAGVTMLDTEIRNAQVADGACGEPEIASLTDCDGREHKFDLYIDCSGFGSFLLEKTLGSEFESFASTLFTNRAIVGAEPLRDGPRAFTTAQTFDHGWCWNISTMDENHIGYVYSTNFTTDEQAELELRREKPHLGEVRGIPFRAGRHRDFWKGNVVAMGNAYGFVEPLESTGIQCLLHMNMFLVNQFPTFKAETAVREGLNQRVRELWDSVRWFLGAHFKFNRRRDTPFWKAYREDCDLSGAAEVLQTFRESAPLVYHLKGLKQLMAFPPYGYDIMLFGQGVAARTMPPRETEAVYRRRVDSYKRLSAMGLNQQQLFQVLTTHRPDLLYEIVQRPSSWLYKYHTAVRQLA